MPVGMPAPHRCAGVPIADEERLEQETAMYAGDIKLWKESNTMIDFKTWLQGKVAR